MNKLYYLLKPFIPRSLQIRIRGLYAIYKRHFYQNVWPIKEDVRQAPEGWTGWPDHKKFALILTHDVETTRGRDKCRQLLQLENELGFKSSFNFVPERYELNAEIRDYITQEGFEVGVHGLNHDGKLYTSKKIFDERTVRINHYIKYWKAVGFRSPSMHHNLEWLGALDIEYDLSTFDTDPFEPQSDGVNTIFPFFVNGSTNQKGYVELPYTLPQDSTLFIIMREKNIDIWKKKLDWIAKKGGMALINVHPDYLNFKGCKLAIDEFPAQYYRDFLIYLIENHNDSYWHVLPSEMAAFWKNLISGFKIK
jgi:hypothetical protein